MRCLFSCLRGFGQGGGDGNLAFQQLVDGAGIGNLQQALALLVVQLAMQGDAARDLVGIRGLAIGVELQIHIAATACGPRTYAG